MLADFNATFKDKPVSGTRVPNLVIRKLSEKLPRGLRYVDVGNGELVMVSESGEMTLGGLIVILPKSFKPVLGDNPSQGDILQLSYNSQTPLEMRLAHEGFITVNGEEMPFDLIHYNIFREIKLLDNKIIAYPKRFPGPLDLSAATWDGRYFRTLRMRREACLSLDRMSFKSEDEQPLRLNIVTSADNAGGTATVNLELRHASTIRDVVESVFIFNDFVDGRARLGGRPFPCDVPEGAVEKFDSDTAAFWEKVLRLEEFLGAHFVVPEGDTDYETICGVEFLYRNLLCGIPVRKNQFLPSVTGAFNFHDKDIEEMEIGGELYFQYQMTYETELFGQKIKLPALCGMFNTAVKDVEKQRNGKVRMDFKDKDPNAPAYTAVLCFKDEESLRAFIENAGGNAADVLKVAKPVGDYLA